jgi:hypothetical protein
MKRRLPLLLAAALAALAVTACEGPDGPVGPRGAQGPEGPAGPTGPQGPAGNTCFDCHTENSTIVAIQQQFALSPHGPDQYELRGPDYAGGACVACHTHQGFVAAVTGTSPDWSAGVAPMSCRTCHRIHTGEGFALENTDPIPFRITGQTVDVSGDGSTAGNLCAMCHQGRAQGSWPSWLAPITQTFSITSSHYGVHYGTQGNVYTTVLEPSFEFGVTVDGTFGPHADVGCEGCHMGIGVDEFNPAPTAPGGELGHTWEPATEVCATCHDADFNFGGVQDQVATDLTALGHCLEAEGVIDFPGGVAAPDIAADHGGIDAPEYHPVVGDHPEPFVAAYLVFNALIEDGSWGVHQPDYARDLARAALAYMQANSSLCP